MCNQLTLNPSRFYTKTPIKIGHQITLMCANFKPLTLEQLKQQQLPMIDFEYVDEVYPGYSLPLMFKKMANINGERSCSVWYLNGQQTSRSPRKLIMPEVKRYYRKQVF